MLPLHGMPKKNVQGACRKIANASGLNEKIIRRVCRIVKKVGQDMNIHRIDRRKEKNFER